MEFREADFLNEFTKAYDPDVQARARRDLIEIENELRAWEDKGP